MCVVGRCEFCWQSSKEFILSKFIFFYRSKFFIFFLFRKFIYKKERFIYVFLNVEKKERFIWYFCDGVNAQTHTHTDTHKTSYDTDIKRIRLSCRCFVSVSMCVTFELPSTNVACLPCQLRFYCTIWYRIFPNSKRLQCID